MAAFITASEAAALLGYSADDPSLPGLCSTADSIARVYLCSGGVTQVEESETFPPEVKFACALIIPALKSAIAHNGRQLSAEAIGDYRASYLQPGSEGLGSLCPAAANLLRPYRAPQM